MKKEKLNIILPEKKGAIKVGDYVQEKGMGIFTWEVLEIEDGLAHCKPLWDFDYYDWKELKDLIKLNRHAILKPSRGKKKGFYFNLVGDNDRKLEVIATSEIYTTREMARKTLKKYFPSFRITDGK